MSEFIETEKLTAAVLTALEDKKAIDSLLINVTGRSTVTDHFVIATGRSDRHLKALAEAAVEVAHQFHLPAHIEGLDALEWLLVDLGDVVVHLFLQEVREAFHLEQLWAETPSVENKVQEDMSVQ